MDTSCLSSYLSRSKSKCSCLKSSLIRMSSGLLYLVLNFYLSFFFFFFKDPAPTEIYPLPLPDALPIWPAEPGHLAAGQGPRRPPDVRFVDGGAVGRSGDREERQGRPGSLRGRLWRTHEPRSAETRSEEHTSELQSRSDLVCRLLLEKKK